MKIEISKTTEHPLNIELYDFDDPKEVKKIKALAKDIEKNGLNIPPSIDKNGVVFSGHRRRRALILLGWTHTDFTQCVDTYNPNGSKVKELEKLEKYNDDKFHERDESLYMIACRKYAVKNKYMLEERNRKLSAGERDRFAVKSNIVPKNFQKAIKIYEGYENKKGEWFDPRQDLLEQVDDRTDTMTLGKALDIIMKNPKGDDKYDPNRHNWIQELSSDTSKKSIIEKAMLGINHSLNNVYYSPILKRHINFVTDKQHGEEENFISTDISNKFQFAVSTTLEELGFDGVHTSKQEAGLEDVRIDGLTKEGYLPERIEIKCTKFKGHGSSTQVKGGIGASAIKPHEFLIVVHDNDYKDYMVLLTTLTKDDWKPRGSERYVSMHKWYENHFDNPEDYVFIAGTLKKQGGVVNVITETLR